jgi:hypothetical protein
VIVAGELERLATVLLACHADRRPQLSPHRLERRTWTTLRAHEDVGHALGLLERDGSGELAVTAHGRQVLTALRAGDWEPLTLTYLRCAAAESELLSLLECEPGRPLPAHHVTRIAPDLGAVLAWVPRWREGSALVVPRELLVEELARRALVLPELPRPEWLAARELVGARAEAYSLHLLRRQHDPTLVLHVSRDFGDGLGYDVELTDREPSLLIEVKGSRDSQLRFSLTAREREVAGREAHRYLVHFWGGIRLSRQPQDEFDTLVRQGYPVLIDDLIARIENGLLVAIPSAWMVSKAREPR